MKSRAGPGEVLSGSLSRSRSSPKQVPVKSQVSPRQVLVKSGVDLGQVPGRSRQSLRRALTGYVNLRMRCSKSENRKPFSKN